MLCLLKINYKSIFFYQFKLLQYFIINGIGGDKSLFSQLDLILKSFKKATGCFLQIYKIQSNFLDIGDQS